LGAGGATNEGFLVLATVFFERNGVSYDLPPLGWLRAFESAARLGNFTRAADELGLTPAAVSHQVRALEQRLGTALFERRHRSLALTRAGETYLPTVAAAFADLQRATQGVFGRRAGATVRFRGLVSFLLLWLAPRLPRFRAAHPEIALHLHAASWTGSLAQDELDLDLRYGDGRWPDGRAELLARAAVLPLCAPALRPPDGDPAALARLPRIEVTGVVDTWESYHARTGARASLAAPALIADQSVTALEMAAAGLGVCLISGLFAEPYLRAGRLVRAAEVALPTEQAFHLVHLDRPSPADREVRALCDWMLAEARAETRADG